MSSLKLRQALLSVSDKTKIVELGKALSQHEIEILATGGTAKATCKLVERLGGKVAGAAFVIELTFLKGREQLQGYDIFSLLQYDE